MNLRNLAAGRHRVEVRTEGAAPVTKKALVHAGRWTQLSLTPMLLVQDPQAREAALSLTREKRRSVQQALNTLGFAVGRADGVWGRNTRRGIKRWQEGGGETASGYLDGDGYKGLLAEAAENKPGSGWVVQVASLPTATIAASHERKLRGSGFAAFVEKEGVVGKIWYRVRVGPEREREAASELAIKVKRRGYPDAFVMHYP